MCDNVGYPWQIKCQIQGGTSDLSLNVGVTFLIILAIGPLGTKVTERLTQKKKTTTHAWDFLHNSQLWPHYFQFEVLWLMASVMYRVPSI